MAVKHRIIPPLSPQDILRFWSKVRIRGPNECWPWMAARSNGYGEFGLYSRTDGSHSQFCAHRVAWRVANGPIPTGLCVCHHYDAPGCCNPRHLFVGTKADNAHDRDTKGRRHAPRGERHSNAKLAEQNVRDIRRRYAAGGIATSALADEYGVGRRQINRILRRISWAHLP